MIDFIVQNIEWLFSGAGAILLVILIEFFRRRSRKEIEKPPPLTPTSIQVAFTDIQKMLDDAVPLQQEQLKESFIGIRVDWDTFLASARKEDDDIIRLLLMVRPDETKIHKGLVGCRVSLNEYRELGILPSGTRIRVQGEIKEVEVRSVELKDVKLFFHSSSEEEGV